jgi:hypothetical protein
MVCFILALSTLVTAEIPALEANLSPQSELPTPKLSYASYQIRMSYTKRALRDSSST